MVPAKSVTSQTLPYLDALRRGPVLPRFATGGRVGGSGGIRGGGAGPSILVEVHNHTQSAQVEAQPSADGRSVKIMILDTVSEGIAGGKFDKQNQAAYGSKRKARSA